MAALLCTSGLPLTVICHTVINIICCNVFVRSCSFTLQYAQTALSNLLSYASTQAKWVVCDACTSCLIMCIQSRYFATHSCVKACPQGNHQRKWGRTHKHVCCLTQAFQHMHSHCWATAGNSSVTTTSTTPSARRLRRLLQASSEDVGMTINLPAGTNVSQVIATLQAASADGYGQLLAAGQAA